MNHKITKTDDLWIFLLDSHTNFKSKYFQSLQKKKKKIATFHQVVRAVDCSIGNLETKSKHSKHNGSCGCNVRYVRVYSASVLHYLH